MRKRLLVATVGTVAIGVLLLGLPLAVAVRGVLTTQAFETLQRQAEQVQVLFNQQQLSGTERRDLLHDLAGQFDVRFQVFDRVIRDGSRVGFLLTEDTGEMANEEVDFTDDLDAAFDGELGRAGRDGVLAVSVPLRIAGVPQVLRAIAPDDELRSSLSAAWLSIGGLAITSLGIAGFVGLMVARRIATPLEDLAEAATALGEGDFSARAMASGIPESDQLAAAAVLARFGQILLVDAPVRNGCGLRPCAQVRQFDDLGQFEASGEVAVKRPGRVEHTVLHLVQHALGMTARILDLQCHTTLGRLLNPLPPRRQDVLVHGVCRRQPGTHPHHGLGRCRYRQTGDQAGAENAPSQNLHS